MKDALYTRTYVAQFSSSTPEAGSDTSVLAVDATEPPKFLHVFCKNCSAEVGFYNVAISSVTLFKWQVICETRLPSRSPSSSECLAATLIATISRSGSAKSVVAPHASSVQDKRYTGPFQSLYLWVLNSNMVYTSSLSQGKTTAMKILYRHIGAEEGYKMTESMNSDVQDIGLPVTAIETARAALESSSSLLPEHERVFRDWRVGLLERWDSETIK